jgi:hypothetical protein
MKQRCIQAVSAAIGRSLTIPETRDIETRIRDAMAKEARKDPAAWQALSQQDQFREGARLAAEEIIKEANLKKLRVARAVETFDANENFTTEQVAQGYDDTRLEALRRTIVPVNDGKGQTTAVESEANGIHATAMSQLVDTWEAIHPNWLGMFANKPAEDSFIRSVYDGQPTGDPRLDKAVQAWRDTADQLRQRFNRGGGDVGKLDNWGMPQSWSRILVMKAGDDFVNDLMQWVDRAKYVHEDGRAYTDDEMRAFLESAKLSILTNGANKQRDGGTPGSAVKANRNSQERQIILKDGIVAVEAFRKYNERNLFSVLEGHTKRMSSNIALIERFGPNADNQFGVLLDNYANEAKMAGMDPDKADAYAFELTEYYNHVAGNNFLPPKRQWLADVAQAMRNLQLFKLGFSPITSITDLNTLQRTVAATGMSRHRLFMNLLAGFNPLNQSEKQAAMRAGLMVKTMAADIGRMAFDAQDAGWTGKAANAFMRMTMLEKMTEVSRRAYSITAMDTIGMLTRDHADIAALQDGDKRFLLNKGIDQATWDIWRAADVDTYGGNHTVLTADAIMRVQGVSDAAKERAATKLMSVILEEQNVAVIEPGVREKVWKDKYQAGTWDGEFMKSVAVFKSFPHAFYLRHIERGLNGFDKPQQKIEYIGKLVVGAMMMGALSNWIADILNGRDPRTIDPREKNGSANLIAALLKGGALGIYGDFLFGDITKYGRTPIETITGPVTGTLAGLDNLVRGNIRQAIVGEDANFASEAVTFGKQFMPSNVWYAKAVFDRIIFDDLQEFLKPGYLANMKSKAQSRNNTTFFWQPGENLPERAPEFR